MRHPPTPRRAAFPSLPRCTPADLWVNPGPSPIRNQLPREYDHCYVVGSCGVQNEITALLRGSKSRKVSNAENTFAGPKPLIPRPKHHSSHFPHSHRKRARAAWGRAWQRGVGAGAVHGDVRRGDQDGVALHQGLVAVPRGPHCTSGPTAATANPHPQGPGRKRRPRYTALASGGPGWPKVFQRFRWMMACWRQQDWGSHDPGTEGGRGLCFPLRRRASDCLSKPNGRR